MAAECGNGGRVGERAVKIRHGGEIVDVVVEMGEGEGKDGVRVEKATVSTTKRRLFEGNVLFKFVEGYNGAWAAFLGCIISCYEGGLGGCIIELFLYYTILMFYK